MTHQTNAQRRVSSFMERVFRYLQEGKKEYTEAEVRLVIAGMQSEISAIEQERDQLRDDVSEQARLNGMGAERELALMAERDSLRAQLAAVGDTQSPSGEPFGYFHAEPFGWTDCEATDEGAIALYERPQAATPKPVPMTWQPIETAPKDGARMLLCIDHGEWGDRVWTGLWADGWMVSYGKARTGPTHWMPLPPPPSAIRARGEAV